MKEQIKALESATTLNTSLNASLNTSSNTLSANENKIANFENNSSMQMTYNEMSDFPVQQLDPIELLQKNLAHLHDLHSKMSFMMREVRYLLKV